jgi:hypothetical protein
MSTPLLRVHKVEMHFNGYAVHNVHPHTETHLHASFDTDNIHLRAFYCLNEMNQNVHLFGPSRHAGPRAADHGKQSAITV